MILHSPMSFCFRHYELSTLRSNESTKAFENEMRNEIKALKDIVNVSFL